MVTTLSVCSNQDQLAGRLTISPCCDPPPTPSSQSIVLFQCTVAVANETVAAFQKLHVVYSTIWRMRERKIDKGGRETKDW